MPRPVPYALLAALAATAVSAEVNRQDPAPKDLWGVYAPGGDCKREPRVRLDGEGLAVLRGGGIEPQTPLEMCRTCVGGHQYEGIEVWLSPQVRGVHAAHFRFNADEKRGVLLIDDSGEGVMGPTLKAVMAAAPFKRCAAPR